MDIIRHDHPNIYAGGPNYSRSVRAGNLLFVSGCTANMSPAKGGTPLEQLRVVLGRITRIVEAEGGKASDIVKLTTFVSNKTHWFPIKGNQVEIYNEFFGLKKQKNNELELQISTIIP